MIYKQTDFMNMRIIVLKLTECILILPWESNDDMFYSHAKI